MATEAEDLHCTALNPRPQRGNVLHRPKPLHWTGRSSAHSVKHDRLQRLQDAKNGTKGDPECWIQTVKGPKDMHVDPPEAWQPTERLQASLQRAHGAQLLRRKNGQLIPRNPPNMQHSAFAGCLEFAAWDFSRPQQVHGLGMHCREIHACVFSGTTCSRKRTTSQRPMLRGFEAEDAMGSRVPWKPNACTRCGVP